AVITESFERIHRSNLVGMGVLPLQFLPGESAKTLGLTGQELFHISGLAELQPLQKVVVKVTPSLGSSGSAREFTVRCRIDTPNEVEYFRNGGILHYVLRQMASGH
ncbi:MAG: aconitate hydratase, partial [Bdellovibrionota bacterium]